MTDGSQLPVVACAVSLSERFSVYDISRGLRERGWQVPAYAFPVNRSDLSVLRFVIRNGFSHDLVDLLLADLARLLPRLTSQTAASAGGDETAFHH